MATARGGLPWIWISWLTPILAGEQQCIYAAWFKSHYRYTKVPDPTFDMAAWTADHTDLVRRRATALIDEGWTVRLENENAFRLKGATAIVAGKSDIVPIRDRAVRIIDGKTGQQKGRDWWQVLLYLFAIPRCWPELADHTFEGEICYRTTSVPIGGHELTPERIQAIGAAVKAVAAASVPTPVPSAAECSRCDLADCTARATALVAEATVEAF
jgi:hypothetical protein